MGYATIHKHYEIDSSRIPTTTKRFLFWRKRKPVKDEQTVLGATYDDRLRLVQGALAVIREIYGKDLILADCLDFAKDIQSTQLPEILKHANAEIDIYEQETETKIGQIKVSAPRWRPGAVIEGSSDVAGYYQRGYFGSGFVAIEVAQNAVIDRQQYYKYNERLDSLVAG